MWLDRKIYLFKVSCPMYSFSENSGGKLPEQEALVYQFLLQKFLILFTTPMCLKFLTEVSYYDLFPTP